MNTAKKKKGRRLSTTLLRYLPGWLQDRLVLGQLQNDPALVANVVAKIADQPEEYAMAARLTFEAYAEKDLLLARGVPVRLTPFLMMPTTVRFVAIREGQVIATVALIVDSALGLPMESVFPQEISVLRSTGRRLAEVGALAVDKAHRRSGVAMLLYKLMWRAATEQLGLDELVVAVHPDAEPMYVCPLRFERLTRQVRQYPGLKRSALAVGLRLNLQTFPAVLEKSFSRLRPGFFNPHQYFCQMLHPQIRLPTNAQQLELISSAQQQATLRLATLRPETVMQMHEEQFKAVSEAFSSWSGSVACPIGDSKPL